MVGLTSDFFVKGGKLVKPEYEFNILNQKPLYLIKGFIDKPFIVGDKIVIDDFKSSKKKSSVKYGLRLKFAPYLPALATNTFCGI